MGQLGKVSVEITGTITSYAEMYTEHMKLHNTIMMMTSIHTDLAQIMIT